MATNTTSEFSRMSVKERIALIQAIWDSIEAEGGSVPLTPAQKSVLRQRAEESTRNPAAECDSAAVDAQIQQRLTRRAEK